jgi:hypothetical protein
MSKNRKFIPPSPESLGLPEVRYDPMGSSQILFGIFKSLGGLKTSRNIWIKLFSIFISLVVFILPGIFIAYINLSIAFPLRSDSILIATPCLLGLILLGAGIEIIYKNIKSINEK